MNGNTWARCLSVAVGAMAAGAAWADPAEPVPNPDYRALRPGYVQTWYIYSDTKTNGILDPGDTLVAKVHNWWSPVSAHTQHNYDDGPYGPNGFTYGAADDKSSGPMSFASKTTPGAENLWLPRLPGTIQFYMSYSQFDNNDFATYYDGKLPPGDQRTMLEQRNLYRNGWHLGWLTNSIEKDADGKVVNDQTPRGTVTMDVYVHNGAGTYVLNGYGISRSSPQVSMSNDIDNLALDGTQWHPPTFDEATGTYKTDSTANAAYKAVLGLTDAEFDTVVASMEIRQRDPADMGVGTAAVDPARTPALIAAGLTEHDGVTPYLYQHAFTDRSTHAVSTSDGGVIAGLAGQSAYDPLINNWAAQQVIRVDLSGLTLSAGSDVDGEGKPLQGNIFEIIFWDFGQAAGSSQVSPYAVVLDLANTALFPEHRFYIAQVEIVPEPTALAIVVAGAVVLVWRRRRLWKPARAA